MNTSATTATAAPATSPRLRAARADAARLATLLGSEHSAMADFILALAAFDASRGWAELGRASLFAFLQRQLHLSNGATYHRAAAARLVQRFPGVAEALRAGRLCLSSTAELSKVLTPGNEAEVLPRFFHLSAREAQEVVAELQPHPNPPAREVVTAVPQAVQRTGQLPVPQRIPSRAEEVHTYEVPRTVTQREQGSSLFDDTVPLTADLRRLHVTVSRRFLQKLETARELRAHARPKATTEALLEEALDLLIAREEKRRTAATTRPRQSVAPLPEPAAAAPPATEPPALQQAPRHRLAPGERRDHVPARVRREVWARDDGRCQWPMDDGTICGSTHRLELDHIRASARGGPPTPANLRILCDRHNEEAARRTYGPGWMRRRTG